MDSEKNIIKVRTRNISKYLSSSNINGNKIFIDNLIEIIKDLNLSEDINIIQAKDILHIIDKQNLGYIYKNEFVNLLEKEKSNKNINLLYNKLCTRYATKSEIIIDKLEKLKNYTINDTLKQLDKNFIITEFDYIINSIIIDDIYEPIIYKNELDDKNIEFFSFVSSFTDKKKQIEDLESVSKSIDIHKTNTFSNILATPKSKIITTIPERKQFNTTNTLNNDNSVKLDLEVKYENDNNSLKLSPPINKLDSNNIKAKLSKNNINNIQLKQSMISSYRYMKDQNKKSNNLDLNRERFSLLYGIEFEEYIKKQIDNSFLKRKSFLNIDPALLINLDKSDFNIFEFEEIVEYNTLPLITKSIFSQKYYFNNLIKENTFNTFIKEINSGYYRKNAYHNDIHAADVLQTVYYILSKSNIEEVINYINL